MNEVITDTYEGTGAAINIPLGFVPSMVILANVEDGDNVALWFQGMAAGTSINIVAAAGPVLNAADGVSEYAGSSSEAPGFSVGTDHSENGKTYRYTAFRGTAPSDG